MEIAVVTGASSGIGREFAVLIDDLGMDEIWLIARTEDMLEDLQQRLETPSKVLSLDLTKVSEIKKFEKSLADVNPRVSYLVNASGFGKFGDYREVSKQDICDMIDLNNKALVLMSQAVLPYMYKGGCIINMSSSSAFTPLPNFNVYASTKAFVLHYSIALRRELCARGINVTAVCPGWVDTDFFEVAESDSTNNRPAAFKPMADVQEVVSLALNDAHRGRAMSVYGLFNKLHRFAAKLLPTCCLMDCWMKMQK